jgi:hypothetical protein
MDHVAANRQETTGFWAMVSAALAALVRKSGCSLLESPLPEIREAARDWRGLPES